MKTGIKLPVTVLLLATPLAAYADTVPPTHVLFALGGGFAGGFLGALVACWLCKRFGSRNDVNSKEK